MINKPDGALGTEGFDDCEGVTSDGVVGVVGVVSEAGEVDGDSDGAGAGAPATAVTTHLIRG